MKIKNLVEESIKEVSQKINVLSIGELSKEKIALIGEYSSLNEKLINIKIGRWNKFAISVHFPTHLSLCVAITEGLPHMRQSFC